MIFNYGFLIGLANAGTWFVDISKSHRRANKDVISYGNAPEDVDVVLNVAVAPHRAFDVAVASNGGIFSDRTGNAAKPPRDTPFRIAFQRAI